IAAATSADVLVISGVSNWGSYGIAACLSLLKGFEYRHDKETELQLLEKAVRTGAIDSITLENKPFVDGLSPSINGIVVNLIWTIVNA
ncbi:MAG: glutamate cyclase domain-containing protein, partial [Candidatus Bathyarchaeia archaeon]